MAVVRVDNQEVEVPEYAPGSGILELPVVKNSAQGKRTVFLADPDTREVEIVDPDRQYHLRDGMRIETTAPSVSGRG